jgi:hypothetical protein
MPSGFFFPATNGYSAFMGANYFDIPVADLTNGMYQIPTAKLPLFGTYPTMLAGVGANGNLGIPAPLTPAELVGDGGGFNFVVPFLDGRTNIQQNINILLRGADNNLPFNVRRWK